MEFDLKELKESKTVAYYEDYGLFVFRPCMLFGSYGFSFGEQVWLLNFRLCSPPADSAVLDVGVVNLKFSDTNRLLGVTVNLSKSEPEILVKLYLDLTKKFLIVQTGSEQAIELPHEGKSFVPAVIIKSGQVLLQNNFEV